MRIHSLSECCRIFADQFIRSHAPRFRMFGIRVERDTGDAEERSFFGYIAGVRDDSFGFIDQISEEKIILRRHDMKIRGFYAEVFDCIAHICVHGRYDRPPEVPARRTIPV